LQLACAPGQPPRADVVALPRAPSLPGGHERPDGLPDSSTDPRLVPAGGGPGSGPARQRGAADAAARLLRRCGRVRPLQHQPELRTAGPGVRQPELPPHPPQGDRCPRRKPRIRADDLGPAHAPRELSHARDRRGRHGAVAASPEGRAAGISSAPPQRPRCPDAGTVPADEGARHAPVRQGTRPEDIGSGEWSAGGSAVSMTSSQRRPTRWVRMLFETTSTGPAVDLAVLAVRIALAWIFIYYGAAKLFGSFPGS